MSTSMPLLAALLALGASGCASMSQPRTALASAPQMVCKHCNCFMPADVDPQAACPVCNCHRQTHACRRGR